MILFVLAEVAGVTRRVGHETLTNTPVLVQQVAEVQEVEADLERSERQLVAYAQAQGIISV